MFYFDECLAHDNNLSIANQAYYPLKAGEYIHTGTLHSGEDIAPGTLHVD